MNAVNLYGVVVADGFLDRALIIEVKDRIDSRHTLPDAVAGESAFSDTSHSHKKAATAGGIQKPLRQPCRLLFSPKKELGAIDFGAYHIAGGQIRQSLKLRQLFDHSFHIGKPIQIIVRKGVMEEIRQAEGQRIPIRAA